MSADVSSFASDGNVADLIGQFYDAALDDDLWAGLSGRIAGTLGATSTVLKLHDPGDRVALVEVTQNMVVADRLQDWAAHWHSHDLWVQRSVSRGLSRIVTDRELVSEDERRKSGFYREWLHHLDIHHMIGAAFPAGEGAIGVLGIHRPDRASPFDDEDRRKVSLLLPHLQRALHLGRRMAQLSHARDLGLQGLDAIDTGVMIVAAGCRVLHASRTAEAMLDRSAELAVRGGRLVADDPGLRSRLNAVVEAALATAAGQVRWAPGLVRIDRPERPPWTLSVTPVRPRWPDLIWQRPSALILMRDPEFPPHEAEALRALYGLTRMEAAVAVRLAGGEAPADMAKNLGIGIGTVRTHLKQILLKTGTSRQAQAVAILSRSVGGRAL